MSRKDDRTHAFNLIFQMEFYTASEFETLKERYVSAMPENTDRVFVERAFDGVAANVAGIDEIISECSEGWELSRLMKTDLAILRLALYEILFDDSVPPKVSINEAVELSKAFSGDDSPGFVNGLLGKAYQKINDEQ